MKKIFVTISLISLCQLTAQGALTFSLQFSNPPAGGALTNIADEANSTASGLSWGILISQSGLDFQTPFNSPLSAVGVNTTDGAELAPGLRYFSGGSTTNVGFGTDIGPGAIDSTGTIDATAFQPGINTGDFFSLIWFERGFSSGDPLALGTQYGILTNSNFVVPSDGTSLQPLSGNFAGVDPLRPANLSVIPEPNVVSLIGVLSFVGLIRRRR